MTIIVEKVRYEKVKGRGSLPKQFTFSYDDIGCEPDDDVDTIEYQAIDTISDITGYLVESAVVKIV